MATTLASGSIDLKSLKVAGEPNKYITYIDSTNGIRVYDSKSNGNYVNFAQLNSNGLQIYKGGTATANKIAQFGEIHVPSNNPTVTIGEVAQDKYNLWMLPKGMFIRQGGALKHFLGDRGLYLNQYTSITPGRMKLATDNGLCFADLYSPNMKTVTQIRTFIIEEGTTESYFSLDARFQSFSINNAQFEIENPASGVTYTGQVQYATSTVAPPTQDWYYGTTYTATYAITPAISGPNSITITYTTTVPAIKFVLGYEIGDRIEIDDGAMKFFKAEDISNPIVNFNKEYIQIGSINEVHTTIDTQGLKIYDNQGSLRADYSDSVILYGGTSSNGAAPYININATNGVTLLKDSTHKAIINGNGMSVYAGDSDYPYATFGEETILGSQASANVRINTRGMKFYNGSTEKFGINYNLSSGSGGQMEWQLSSAIRSYVETGGGSSYSFAGMGARHDAIEYAAISFHSESGIDRSQVGIRAEDGTNWNYITVKPTRTIMTSPLRIEGHDSDIGTVLTKSNTGISRASGTTFANLTGIYVDVTPGTWAFEYSVYCDVNKADSRLGGRLYNNTSSTEWNFSRSIAYTSGTAAVAVTGSAFVNFSDNSRIYVQAFQNGNASTVSAYLRAVRIS